MDRLTELATMPYADYLLTPEWQVRREQALERAGNRCQVCNSPDNLNVHHRTYERRGNEAASDLTTLCGKCHERFHNKMPVEAIERLFRVPLKTFEMFRIPEAWGDQTLPLEVARMFADLLQGTLILHGSYGTGKSHLFSGICHAIKVDYLYVSAPTLFHVIQDYTVRKESYDFIIRLLQQTSLLVIDDIDRARWSEFREEVYFMIIDERVNAGRPTAISTNKLDELPRYVGGAVASRLSVGLIEVDMSGEDYRREL